jgi:hypothetical protein
MPIQGVGDLSSMVGLVGSGLAPLYSLTTDGITTFTKSLP